MATGCSFICDNDACEHYGKSIVLTGPWPMADMDIMIKELEDNQGDVNSIENLKSLQEDGRQYACLTLPNESELEIQSYRIQKWCNKCHIIAVFEVEDEIVVEVSERNDLCMACEIEFLVNYMDALADGITCPFCHVTMKQERWYAND